MGSSCRNQAMEPMWPPVLHRVLRECVAYSQRKSSVTPGNNSLSGLARGFLGFLMGFLGTSLGDEK